MCHTPRDLFSARFVLFFIFACICVYLISQIRRRTQTGSCVPVLRGEKEEIRQRFVLFLSFIRVRRRGTRGISPLKG